MSEELKVIETYKSGSVQYIDSREVAEMVGKEHKHLMRDIRRYCSQIEEINQSNLGLIDSNQLNIALSDFFMESTYVDGKGERRVCYLVTKKGCEFIAHKLTGIKGTKFTATYINRFHEMEDALDAYTISKFVEQMERQTRRIDELESRISGGVVYDRNPFSLVILPGRKENLDGLVSEVARLCKLDKSKVLHYLYRTVEENLKVSIDAIKSFYRMETDNSGMSTFETVIRSNQLYAEAVRLCEETIERKRVFG